MPPEQPDPILAQNHSSTIRNRVEILVNNTAVRALVDTGATLSCIDAELLNATNHAAYLNLEPSPRHITGINNTTRPVLGETSLWLTFADVALSQHFLVVTDLGPKLILGLDFIVNNDAKLDFDSHTMTLHEEHTAPLITDQQNTPAVVTDCLFVLPPQNECLIPLVAEDALPTQEHAWLLTPSPHTLGQYGFQSAHALVAPQGQRLMGRLCNPNSDPVIVYPGTVIGHLQVTTPPVLPKPPELTPK